MILFKRSEDLRKWLAGKNNKGGKTGFVPTMGALHEGHIRLIEACRSQTDLCICSIFVNPAQFNDRKDFKKYPVSLEKDIEMLENAGTDLVFIPSVHEIYPRGIQDWKPMIWAPLKPSWKVVTGRDISRESVR